MNIYENKHGDLLTKAVVSKARFNAGDRCRCTHHYAFRGKEPFTIVSIAPLRDASHELYYVYVVRYDDGALDSIPVWNEGGYKMERVSK